MFFKWFSKISCFKKVFWAVRKVKLIWIYLYMNLNIGSQESAYINVGGLKNSSGQVIYAVDDIFDQWYPSTATLIEEVCWLQRDYVKK